MILLIMDFIIEDIDGTDVLEIRFSATDLMLILQLFIEVL